jgi:hypothetical protein
MPPILLLLIIICDSAPLPASSISTQGGAFQKIILKTMHGSFQFGAGIIHTRRVSGRFLGCPTVVLPTNQISWLFLKKVSGAGRYYYWKLPQTPPDIMAVLRALHSQQQVFAKSKVFQNPELAVLWYRKNVLKNPNQISKIKTRSSSKIKFDSDFSSKPRTGSSLIRKWSSKEKPVSISKIKLDSKFSLQYRTGGSLIGM